MLDIWLKRVYQYYYLNADYLELANVQSDKIFFKEFKR